MRYSDTRALVVGGGIVGTATGLVLARLGMQTSIVERHGWSAPGYGITMIGPALRALDHLGLLDTCLENGFGVETLTICNVAGEKQHTIPLPRLLGPERPGLLGMMRPTLHRILADAARGEGIDAREQTWPTALRQSGDEVEVELSDGSTRTYDLVLGADGLNSWVRTQLFGEIEPQFQHQGGFRAVLPKPSEVQGSFQFHGHPTTHPGFTPTGPDSMYMFGVVPADEPTVVPKEEQPQRMREALADFGGLAAKAAEQIVDPDRTDYRPFETVIVPKPWHRGRVALIGDAAHTTTPHLAAGAAMGLEDTVVLDEELGRDGTIEEALARYGERRFDRCKYVVDGSIKLGYWQTHPGTPDADPMGLMIEATQRIAEPF